MKRKCCFCDAELKNGEGVKFDNQHVMCYECAEKFEQEFAFDFEEKEVNFQIT